MHGPARPETLERKNRELAILNAVATALNESVDLPTSLGAVLSRVAELLDLRTGWVWLFDAETDAPYLAAAQNLPPGLRDRPESMQGSCFCLRAFRGGDLAGAANVVECSRLRSLSDGTQGLRFHATIPLHARGEELGVLNVASPEWRRLSPADLELLNTIGDMLGTAIERARLYARSVEAGATEERNRLAREIHDTLAQGLSATALHLDTAEALLDGGADADALKAAIHRALDATRENLEEARRSVLDLRAAPLRGRTLYEALEALCADSSSSRAAGAPPPRSTDASSAPSADASASRSEDAAHVEGPVVRFQRVGGARRLPPRVEAALFRVAQEAVSNVLRHAGAETASVRIVTEPGCITLSVEDDGRGFEPAKAGSGRFGLIGMRERVRLLGGELRVESGPGEGTALRAVVPLE